MSASVQDAWGVRTTGKDYLVVLATPCNIAIAGDEIEQVHTPKPTETSEATSLDELLSIRQVDGGGGRQVLVLRRYHFGAGLLLTCSPRIERFAHLDILPLPEILTRRSAFSALLTVSEKVRALVLDLFRFEQIYNVDKKHTCEEGASLLPSAPSAICPETLRT